jgi:hypothetical protein
MANINLVLGLNDVLTVNGVKITFNDSWVEMSNVFGSRSLGVSMESVKPQVVPTVVSTIPTVVSQPSVPSVPQVVTKSFSPRCKVLHVNGNLDEVKEQIKEYRKEAKANGYKIRVYTRNKDRKSLIGCKSQTGYRPKDHESLRRYVPMNHADRLCLYYYKKVPSRYGNGYSYDSVSSIVGM